MGMDAIDDGAGERGGVKRVCLLGAELDAKNRGVGALTAGAVKCVMKSFPQAEIFILDYGMEPAWRDFTAGSETTRVELVNLRFSKRLFLRNNIALMILKAAVSRLIPFKGLRARFISRDPCLSRIEGADVATSIAGGDSFSDIYGLTRFFYVVLPQILVLIMGKDLVLLPQTIGPFKGWLSRLIAVRILKRSKTVYSRDRAGLEEARSLLSGRIDGARFRFCYDVGFVLDPVRPGSLDIEGFSGKFESRDLLVGLNVSGLLYMGGYTRDNMFGLKADYRKLVHALIEFLIMEKGAHVLLVPHVYGSREDAESDSAVSAGIYSELRVRYGGRLLIARGDYNQHEVKYIIGLCGFFIGARMHACIAALSQNIPAVAIAYSRKFEGVMESIGFKALVADPRHSTQEEILRIVDGALTDRAAIRKGLEGKMPEVRDQVAGLFKDFAEARR